MTDWHTRSVRELSQALANREITALALTHFFLDRIHRYDPQLNSFITTTAEHAEQQARAADQRIQSGKAHCLTGIPIAHKDIFCTQGIKTTCGSFMLDRFIAPYNATVVEKLAATGAVLLGKTNMDEFAMGSSNETSYYGSTRNPWDTTRVPGGSSGGSAAAVAARLVPLATGSDTGGSIRQPAALTGITGIKPTYGRISRYGMIAFASSLDQAGVMAVSAEDAAWMLEAMAGPDPRDSTCLDEPVPAYSTQLAMPINGIRIGVPQEFLGDGLHPAIAEALAAVQTTLGEQGVQIVPISLPRLHTAIAVYYVLAPAECASNLARYDGVRFGHRSVQVRDLADLYEASRQEGFGHEVKRRILMGTYALSAGHFDAYYTQAQKVRQVLANDFQQAFQHVDVILGPTTPDVAFPLGSRSADPLAMYLSDIYTIAPNLAGLPSLSMPAGFVEGLPVGVQLTGNYRSEGQLLQIAHQYQQQTPWHQQVPARFAAA